MDCKLKRGRYTLGGSALFNRRMTERLKERLARDAPRPVEVLGAALRAHTTWSSVHKYRHLARYGFDVVLIYHAINDLKANHVAREDFRPDYSQLGPWYRRGPLLDRSVVARLVHERLLYRKPPFVVMGARFMTSAWGNRRFRCPRRWSKPCAWQHRRRTTSPSRVCQPFARPSPSATEPRTDLTSSRTAFWSGPGPRS